MVRAVGYLAAALCAFSTEVLGAGDGKTQVLVVYAAGQFDTIKQVANSIGEGASSVGADVKIVEVSSANYKRDVAEWADAVVLGTGVFNGNPDPRLLEFINSFDFMDDLSMKVGGAFATGGAAAAGLELTLTSLNRGLKTFGMISVGGSNWRNAHGTGVVATHDEMIDDERHSLGLAVDQGKRIATVAAELKQGSRISPGGVAPPNAGVTQLLNSVTESLGRAHWTHETKLHATCESYCRGWMAAAGCGTCSPTAFSGGAFFDLLCVQPGPTGTGLLCRMDQDTLEPTGESCCGIGGQCELPTEASPVDDSDTSLWPAGCCVVGNGEPPSCDRCPGGSPVSDRFPLLNSTLTLPENRRYFDYSTNTCKLGTQPELLL